MLRHQHLYQRPEVTARTPREYLNSQERVIFETKPHFIAVVGISMLVWFFLGTVILLSLAAATARFAAALGFFFGIIWLLLVLLPFVLQVVSWTRRFYTLTDQRILVGSGLVGRRFEAFQLVRIGGMLDISTYRITSVTFQQGWVGRVFGFGDIAFGTNQSSRPTILWKGTKNPIEVRRLVEETVSKLQETKGNENTYTEEVVRKVADVKTEESFGLVAPSKPGVTFAEAGGQVDPPRQPSLSEVRYCPNCGKQNIVDARFCNYCGKPMPHS